MTNPHDLGDDFHSELQLPPPELIDRGLIERAGFIDVAVSIRFVSAGRIIEWLECSSRTSLDLWLSGERELVWVKKRVRDIPSFYSRVSSWFFLCAMALLIVVLMVIAITVVIASVVVMSCVLLCVFTVFIAACVMGYKRIKKGYIRQTEWVRLDAAVWDSALAYIWARYTAKHSVESILKNVDMIVLGD